MSGAFKDARPSPGRAAHRVRGTSASKSPARQAASARRSVERPCSSMSAAGPLGGCQSAWLFVRDARRRVSPSPARMRHACSSAPLRFERRLRDRLEHRRKHILRGGGAPEQIEVPVQRHHVLAVARALARRRRFVAQPLVHQIDRVAMPEAVVGACEERDALVSEVVRDQIAGHRRRARARHSCLRSACTRARRFSALARCPEPCSAPARRQPGPSRARTTWRPVRATSLFVLPTGPASRPGSAR